MVLLLQPHTRASVDPRATTAVEAFMRGTIPFAATPGDRAE
jgi:hypothetical protein